MATVNANLFYKSRNFGVGIITFDLILSESHNMSNIVTQFKIEDGSIISDHIQNDIRQGSVSGLITNFSLFTPGFFTNRAQLAFDTIEQLWLGKQLVNIVSVYKVYRNVAITNISIVKDSGVGESLVADFSFQEVEKVSLKTINIEAAITVTDMSTDINRQSSQNLDVGKTVPL